MDRAIMRTLICMLILAVLSALALQAQDLSAENRDKYYRIEELIDLIEQAREAGMSEEDLRNLEIRDGDKVINVYDYIEQERLERLRKKKLLEELLSKKFLTVNDIYDELIKSEPEEIQKLREELASER